MAEVGLALGFRSGLEVKIAGELERLLGHPPAYETVAIPYTKPAKLARYTPDWVLPNGIIVESKGRFLTVDRQKHLLVKLQHPDLDLRFVFSNPNQRISKQSATTYAAWCQAKGFLFAKASVPKEWISEPMNERSLRAIKDLMKCR